MSMWELPKIRGPDVEPKIVVLLLYGHPRKWTPQFTETAISGSSRQEASDSWHLRSSRWTSFQWVCQCPPSGPVVSLTC